MKPILTIIGIIVSFSLFGQESDCTFTVKGIVIDSNTMKPLEYTNIALAGTNNKGTSTNAKGNFSISLPCRQQVELHISHLQCEHIHIYLSLTKDTFITVYLKHSDLILDGFTVTQKSSRQEILLLKAKDIEVQKGVSISELMQNIGGITLLKTGGSISKPVVNGLHGNRVIILNNGVRQEGQNWGMEHAPEIDAFLATEIELLKGAEALRYAADGIGGTIMIRPPSIFNEKEKTLKGEFNSGYLTNGRGIYTSLILGNRLSAKLPIYWRVQGTWKRSGNIKSPHYYLANTGAEELNYSAAIGYQLHNVKMELFYSAFTSKIAIFKGSHIGSLSDLQRAFNADTPLVQSNFTYSIGRPYQKAGHRLSKFNIEWQVNSRSKVQLSIAYQQNHREEYDMLRSATSYTGPGFDYYINTWLADIALLKTDLHLFNFSTGLNFTSQANSYTGRFFIPGFYSRGMAGYFIADKTIGRLRLDAALRYDYKNMKSYLWTGNQLYIDKLSFNNGTYALQAAYQLNRCFKLGAGTFSSWRPPSANELYSNGLHQGVASIEIGDSALTPERSFYHQLNLKYTKRKFYFESELYYKRINGFINLVPSMPPQVTIRGAFPVYKYVQQDVEIYGVNLIVRKEMKKNFFVKISSNLLFGNNLNSKTVLSQMPPLSAKLWLGRETKKYMVQVWYQATAKQYRYTEGTDYVAPPKGFALFGLDASYNFKVKNRSFKFNMSINNMLNTRYREYLNRFRYFTDEPGFGITFRLIVPINISKHQH